MYSPEFLGNSPETFVPGPNVRRYLAGRLTRFAMRQGDERTSETVDGVVLGLRFGNIRDVVSAIRLAAVLRESVPEPQPLATIVRHPTAQPRATTSAHVRAA